MDLELLQLSDNLPQALCLLRRRQRWSQERLAQELGVTLTTVSRWERGRGRPSPMAMRLITALMQRKTTGAEE